MQAPPFCGSRIGAQCVWRETASGTTGRKLGAPTLPMPCATADDMFAYIPKRYAMNYFGLRKGRARARTAVEASDKRCCEEGNADSAIR